MLWPLLAAASVLVTLLLAPAPAEAAGKAFYASPSGSGSVCSQPFPCEIGEGIAKAGDGDAVSLASGRYETLPFAGLSIEDEIEFGAVPGDPAILVTTETADLQVTSEADAALHDLRLEGEGGLQLESGSADRIFVAYTGVNSDACQLQKGTLLRNSVCWIQQLDNEEEGQSNAIDVSAGGEGLDEPVILRNVTAYADTDDGNAIKVAAGFGARLTVDAANVIARSARDVDVVAALNGGLLPEAHLNIVNSSFGEFIDAPAAATVTPLGSAGNIAAAPSFVNPANGDFHVGAGSPTIDGGVADVAVGPLDLDGRDRASAGCLEGVAVPDMGAYERTATDGCPPPPPPPPPPVEPRKPVFRIVGLKLNRKTGAGRVLVEVPGAGTVSLTGNGVKLVRRKAPAGGGVVSMPIKTWAITRVRLAKRGKTRVRLRVIFEGRSGGFKQWGRGVLLRKKGKAAKKKKHRKHQRR